MLRGVGWVRLCTDTQAESVPSVSINGAEAANVSSR